MIAELKKTIELLEKINNSNVVYEKVPEALLEEQVSRIKKIENLLNDYSLFLKASEEIGLTKKTAEEILVRIHMELMSFIHCIDQIDELLATILKKVPN